MSTDRSTDQMRFDDLLSESNSLLSQFLEFSPDATLVFDNQRTIVFANSQAAKLFRYEDESLVGQTLHQLIPDRYHPSHAKHESAYMRHPDKRPMGRAGESDLVARRRDESEFPVDISLSPLKTDVGTWIVAAVRDITARKEAEEKVRKYAAELERSNKELESFAHVAAHDLGAPLRRVGMVGHMIRDEYFAKLDESGREFLDILVDSVREMEKLIKELLAHSKVGAQSLQFKDVEVKEAIESALLDFADLIEKYRISIEYESLPTIQADPVSFGRLIENLIGNAIHYRADRPLVIRIDVQQQDGKWNFRFTDNGIGIDPQYHESIFQIFKRLHGDRIPGTGIGLATCKKIVELHGGTIGVESEPDQGSTFHFTIPVSP